MSDHLLDYDPLQEQIRAALSRAAGVARDLEAVVRHVPKTCRRLIRGLVQDLHQGRILPQRVVRDLQVVIEHAEREITRGERHNIIVDEHCAEGAYSQIVYTSDAEVLRERLPSLRQMHTHLTAIHHICAAEGLALEMRTDRQR
ncbi:hypothetical protein [uncultured Sulfitobacter sp.]|jgi:hypothetical protein|uniref:hypothetical protein n=1 Tax=Sulfitobacter sp. SH22 TaxID=3421172 RepID=UPI0025D0B091|nr:hypothetical protein [uncultured Sulfitobacter sp.]